MSDKKIITLVKLNHERTIQGLKTRLKQFYYDDTTGYVKPDQLYSVYYTLSKKEVFLTGILPSTNSRIIKLTGQSSVFTQYTDIASPERQVYPTVTPAKPSKSDYEIGEITRYYTQVGNDTSKPIFEVSEETYKNQNNLYRYTEFKWRLSGLKEEVMRDNQRTIDGLEKEYSGISKVLFPLQLWKASKNSTDDVENKLLLMKKT
jgi:hypothetical protein